MSSAPFRTAPKSMVISKKYCMEFRALAVSGKVHGGIRVVRTRWQRYGTRFSRTGAAVLWKEAGRKSKTLLSEQVQ